jgi:L-asparaginase II
MQKNMCTCVVFHRRSYRLNAYRDCHGMNERGHKMTDESLIRALRAELTHLASRGFPTVACNVGELANRFERLATAHKLLAEREERLTQMCVKADLI